MPCLVTLVFVGRPDRVPLSSRQTTDSPGARRARPATGADERGAMRLLGDAGRYTTPEAEPNHYIEHLRSADLSVGTYSIPAGGVDDQTPHTEDEIYVVSNGRATIETPTGSAEVDPGTVIFVPAAEEHRFTHVTEDLALLVLFAPPEGARSNP